jgi:hypothetical protein
MKLLAWLLVLLASVYGADLIGLHNSLGHQVPEFLDIDADTNFTIEWCVDGSILDNYSPITVF